MVVTRVLLFGADIRVRSRDTTESSPSPSSDDA